MLKYPVLLLLIGLVVFASGFRDPEMNLNKVKKDLAKLYDTENVELKEVHIPDSLYNDLLLDNGQLYEFSHGSEVAGFVYIGRIFSCRAGGCNAGDADGYEASSESVNDDFEFFDYYTIFGPDAQVVKVKVYNYQATHGQEVCSSGWLKQFIGYSGEQKLTYGKDIDALSGATISANAITYGIQESVQYLKMVMPVLSADTTVTGRLMTK